MKLIAFIVILFVQFLCVSPALAKPLDKVNVQLSWLHQFQFAGFYAALSQGFYKNEGLDVTLLEGGPGVVCNEALLHTKVNYCNATGSVVQRRVAGEKIVVLASIIQYSPVVLLTRKDSGLEVVKDLIGKRVETMSAGLPLVSIEAMFQSQGIELSQLDNREDTVGIDLLLNKTVDALYGFTSNEPYQLALAGVEFNAIRPLDYDIDFYGDVIITSERELELYKGRAKRFRSATIQGWRYALKNKVAMVDHIIEHYSQNKTKQALLAEATVIETLMLPNLIQIGHNNIERWEATAATLASINTIDKDYSLDGFIYQENDVESTYRSLLWIGGGFILLCWLIGILFLNNRRLAAEVQVQIVGKKNLQEAQDAAIIQAYTDELSGMGNRRSCYEYGAQAVEHTKAHKEPLSIIMIDIDHFKKINDEYGHAVGDEVICTIARVIVGRVRETDIQGRVGGEEFAVILPDTDIKGACSLAEEIRQALESTSVVVDDVTINITASFGVAAFKSDRDDICSIVKRSDVALYRAKAAGRNIVKTN
ncbi:GGDEF domain-containing protein [Leucothrix arctica]|uniref:diguanylate cyclase n=1 Tax=Leucothrix arctica TaxID=1481894 RepID=A0A317CFL3_9GAMM|nr:GGDEF domain-containing protein [Leucothrix arctica]PWQ96203.1 hypothetical protein DKT75_09415 [Leucothrix arctica]